MPAFLPEVPIDWMDGQPLRYRLRSDGSYLLYSVGADGIDQGGDPERTSESRGSWEGRDDVWPQPATTEEVDAANDRIIVEHYLEGIGLAMPTMEEAPPEPEDAAHP
ncbi:MAG: hypothetical protein H7A46_10730 [Verrucomicrobiales bacterium]|nr:hypothetical protein [Verrucomicrobiales bacterium]